MHTAQDLLEFAGQTADPHAAALLMESAHHVAVFEAARSGEQADIARLSSREMRRQSGTTAPPLTDDIRQEALAGALALLRAVRLRAVDLAEYEALEEEKDT